MNNVRRYSLIYTYKGLSHIVKLKEYDEKKGKIVEKDKVLLPTIDLFTSNFTSMEELAQYLGLPIGSKLRIIYQSNKTQKELSCIFRNNKLMRYFANEFVENDNTISSNDACFRRFLNKLFVGVCKPDVRNNIMRDHSVNTYIKDKISEYLEFTKDEIFVLRKIELELLNYKNLRSLVLNIQNTEREKYLNLLTFPVPFVEDTILEDNVELTRFIPTDDYEEPLFAPNSEEERMYNDYIDNLPCEYSCHEDKQKTKKR